MDDPLAVMAVEGAHEKEGYRLGAAVKRAGNQKNWFRIELTVTRPENVTKRQEVAIVLHPTFPEPVEQTTFQGTVARHELWAYGAFTVVAQVEGGPQLVLNLTKIDGAPAEFREN